MEARDGAIATNGLGRIGRAAFNIILERPDLDLRAVNDLNVADDLAYLLNYDTVYGRYHKKFSPVPDGLRMRRRRILCSENKTLHGCRDVLKHRGQEKSSSMQDRLKSQRRRSRLAFQWP